MLSLFLSLSLSLSVGLHAYIHTHTHTHTHTRVGLFRRSTTRCMMYDCCFHASSPRCRPAQNGSKSTSQLGSTSSAPCIHGHCWRSPPPRPPVADSSCKTSTTARKSSTSPRSLRKGHDRAGAAQRGKKRSAAEADGASTSSSATTNDGGTVVASPPWTLQEREMARKGVSLFGGADPCNVAAFVGTRSCMEVYEHLRSVVALLFVLFRDSDLPDSVHTRTCVYCW